MFKSNDKVVIGYEISEEYVQISFLKWNQEKPMTFSISPDYEQYNIPIVLYRNQRKDQWLLEKQIEKLENKEEVVLVDQLWNRAFRDEQIEIGEESFQATAVLALFMKHTFSQLYLQTNLSQYEGVMFTLPEITTQISMFLDRVIPKLKLKTKHIHYQSNAESFCAYVMHQPEELWHRQVVAFDSSKGYLKRYCFSCNRFTIPRILTVEESVYKELDMQEIGKDNETNQLASKLFLGIVKDTLSKSVVSGIYLIGEDMAKDWTKIAMPELCRNRRVFQGSNLFSKGACFGIQDKVRPDENLHNYLYLGEDKLKSNIGMEVMSQGSKSYIPLLNGGENWYDVKKEVDLVLYDENVFSILVTPLNGRNKKELIMTLEGLSVSKERMTRIRMKMWASSVNQIHMHIEDMGFGEFFPRTSQIWEEEFEL